MKLLAGFLAVIMLLLAGGVQANPLDLPALTVTTEGDSQEWSLSIQVLLLMTMLTLLPGIVLTMTSFVRIVIVLAILRQALGTAQTPPNQVLLALALFLTLFVMGPVLERVYQEGVQPYMEGELVAQDALAAAGAPLREFMLTQTRERDLSMFAEMSGQTFEGINDVSWRVSIPAFITSELKTAFQIGFLIYIPFVIIDLVVASVLMSMGMMMLSPMLISMPFKIMLFVLVDGWVLVASTLAMSFVPGGEM